MALVYGGLASAALMGTVALLVLHRRYLHIQSNVARKDALEALVDDLVARGATVSNSQCPEEAMCLFELDDDANVLAHQGSWLGPVLESHKARLAHSIRTGAVQRGDYVYVHDSATKTGLALYMKSRPDHKSAVGVAIDSKCRVRAKK